MTPVATWVFEPYLRKHANLWTRTSHMLAAARLAIDNVARIYGRPRVYTDTLGRDILSELSTNADYIVCYDGLFAQVSPRVWMYPKLLTYQQQTQRYFHFDLDLICLAPFTGNVFNANIVVQNTESVIDELTAKSYNVDAVRDFYVLPEIYHRPDVEQVPVYNQGFFYIDDMGFNREYADTAIRIIQDNQDAIRNREPVIGPCVIEQQTLGLMLRDRPDLRVETLVEHKVKLARWNTEFVHYFGWAKNHDHPVAKKWHDLWLVPAIDKKILAIAAKINSLIT